MSSSNTVIAVRHKYNKNTWKTNGNSDDETANENNRCFRKIIWNTNVRCHVKNKENETNKNLIFSINELGEGQIVTEKDKTGK